MKKNLFALTIFILVGVFAMMACSSQEDSVDADGPEAIYWEYWEACNGRKADLAATYLTAEAELDARTSGGVCAFTHDYVFQVGKFVGPPEDLEQFSQATPVVSEEENRASLTWYPIEGSTTPIVVLRMIDGNWKIDEIHIMY